MNKGSAGREPRRKSGGAGSAAPPSRSAAQPPHSAAVSPTGEEVRVRLLHLQARRPEFVRARTVLNSAEGRPIDAVTITDPKAADADKQHVLIAAGQHGNEET